VYPNGDGYLVYPGAPIGQDRAVPSVRLAQVREGLEDYQLLALLETKIAEGRAAELRVDDAEEAMRGIADLATIPSASGRWSTALLPSPEALYEARNKVGEAIETIENALRRRPGPSRDSIRCRRH
jgi:hypothetical protein